MIFFIVGRYWDALWIDGKSSINCTEAGSLSRDGVIIRIGPFCAAILADLELPETDFREQRTHRPGKSGEMAVQITRVVLPGSACNFCSKDTGCLVASDKFRAMAGIFSGSMIPGDVEEFVKAGREVDCRIGSCARPLGDKPGKGIFRQRVMLRPEQVEGMLWYRPFDMSGSPNGNVMLA